jgi:hypothetical protein
MPIGGRPEAAGRGYPVIAVAHTSGTATPLTTAATKHILAQNAKVPVFQAFLCHFPDRVVAIPVRSRIPELVRDACLSRMPAFL